MASVETKDIPEIGKFMEDFWRLVKEFWVPEDREQYWQNVIDQVEELTKKYPDEFCRGQCLEYVSYLDKVAKKMRGERQ